MTQPFLQNKSRMMQHEDTPMNLIRKFQRDNLKLANSDVVHYFRSYLCRKTRIFALVAYQRWSSGRLMVSKKLYNMQKKVVVAYLQEMWKTTQNLSEDSRCPGRHSTRTPPARRPENPTAQWRQTVVNLVSWLTDPETYPSPFSVLKTTDSPHRKHNIFHFYDILTANAVRFAQWCRWIVQAPVIGSRTDWHTVAGVS